MYLGGILKIHCIWLPSATSCSPYLLFVARLTERLSEGLRNTNPNVFGSVSKKGMSMSDIILTDANFAEEVMKSTLPVLVDFWATWCGPCVVQGPIVEELATAMAGKVKVGKMDVDQNPQTPSTYGIMSIPTLLIFQKGQVVKQFVGVQSKETLMSALSSLS